MRVVHEVCCGLDVHKTSVTACVLWATGRRRQTREFGTFTRELRQVADSHSRWPPRAKNSNLASRAGCRECADCDPFISQPFAALLTMLESAGGVVQVESMAPTPKAKSPRMPQMTRCGKCGIPGSSPIDPHQRANALQAKTSPGTDADAARVRALAAYKDFLALWKDADPDIPFLIAAKSEYAKLQ